jgi:predicted murein hydrolase (TIGR00659 family)
LNTKEENTMAKEVMASILYIVLTILVYLVSNKIYKKFNNAVLNPIITSSIVILIILSIFKVPFAEYNKGGKFISDFLGPIVVVLAIPLYKNKNEIIKNFMPIIGGIIAGIITSFITVLVLSKIFNIDNAIMLSLLAKSITTPMAVESTKLLGGNESITLLAVLLTGLIGSAIAPAVIKYSKIKNNIAKGIAVGTSSHAIGTSKAVEMGEEIGATSSLAIGVTGLITILLIIIFT